VAVAADGGKTQRQGLAHGCAKGEGKLTKRRRGGGGETRREVDGNKHDRSTRVSKRGKFVYGERAGLARWGEKEKDLR